MEKVHENYGVPFYLACSLGCLLDHREILADEQKKLIDLNQHGRPRQKFPVMFNKDGITFDFSLRVPEFINNLIGEENLLGLGGYKTKGLEMMGGTLIYIPTVRHLNPSDTAHYAQEFHDQRVDKNRLLIFDQEGSCDTVKLPSRFTNRLQDPLQRPNFSLLKETSWASDVVLRAIYSEDEEFDEYGLFAVINRHVNQARDESAKTFFHQLAASPQSNT